MMNTTDSIVPGTLFTAAVMAGERKGKQPVADAAGVCCKAMVPVAGKPMLRRVLDALRASELIGEISIVGLPREVEDLFPGLKLLPGKNSPCASACHVLELCSEQLPLLVTTADHALLTAEMVDFFCQKAARTDADLVVAVAAIDTNDTQFPGLKRTLKRFRGQAYSGCNLYAFMRPAARVVPEHWLQVEQKRKSAWRVISQLGWVSVLSYLLGRLSLEDALAKLSAKLGVRIEAVVMPFPEAAIDVDTVADWHIVNRYLGFPLEVE